MEFQEAPGRISITSNQMPPTVDNPTDGANVFPFIADAIPSEPTHSPQGVEQPSMPAGNASAPPVATDRVVPFSAEDDASLELPTASAVVVKADGPAEERVEVSVASEVGRHGDAAARAAAWTADVSQDFAWRQAMVLKMQQVQGEQVYTEEETALLAKGLELFDSFAAARGKARSLKNAKTVVHARTKHDEKSGLLIGEAQALIRASPEQIVAYQMHFDSKHRLFPS